MVKERYKEKQERRKKDEHFKLENEIKKKHKNDERKQKTKK